MKAIIRIAEDFPEQPQEPQQQLLTTAESKPRKDMKTCLGTLTKLFLMLKVRICLLSESKMIAFHRSRLWSRLR